MFTSRTKRRRPRQDEIIPDVEITEAEYRKNPLAADVKYWGHWVLEQAASERLAGSTRLILMATYR